MQILRDLKWHVIECSTFNNCHPKCFTVHNSICRKVCFHRCVSFCPGVGGGISDPQSLPGGRGCMYINTHLLTSSGGYQSGRYAFYWNALMFKLCEMLSCDTGTFCCSSNSCPKAVLVFLFIKLYGNQGHFANSRLSLKSEKHQTRHCVVILNK